MSQLDQLPAGAVVRVRPWDVVGAALAAPMVLWGFLGWFGTVGDSSGGASGFFSGAGAGGIALVFAATALTINQILLGRAHDRSSPPLSALLSAAAVIIILGGMIAKPDSATIQAGAVAGLLTALSQSVALTIGWITGSKKAVKAANVRAVDAQQAAADLAAAGNFGPAYTGYGNGNRYPPGYQPQGYQPPSYGAPQYGQPSSGQPSSGQPQYGQPAYGQPSYGQPSYGQAPNGQPPYGQNYPSGPGQPGGYPYAAPSGYPPAGGRPGQSPNPPPR